MEHIEIILLNILMYWYQESMRVLLIVDATTEALLFGLPVGVEKMDMKRSGVLSRIINPMNPVKRT